MPTSNPGRLSVRVDRLLDWGRRREMLSAALLFTVILFGFFWPMLIGSWHIIPAIRTGNTVVIKPSPYTPLSTIRMVELMNEVLPPGVVNFVTRNCNVIPFHKPRQQSNYILVGILGTRNFYTSNAIFIFTSFLF